MSQPDLTAVRSPWLLGFAVVTVVHLVLNATGTTPWDSITKCLLAPLLIGWVVQLGGPRLLIAALAFCFLGDLFLEIEDLFTVGMAAFAAAHVCFIVFFVQRGAVQALRTKPWIAVMYAVAAVALIIWLWNDLPSDIRPLVPIYAALLSTTAATALAVDLRAGIGGALFLISDGIIAASEADRLASDSAATGLAIMTLYIAAIFMLTTAILNKERRSVAAARADGTGFDPTQRTDCWPTLPDHATR